MYLRERWQGSGGPDGVVSPLSAQPTHRHTACLLWLTGACWLDDRAMPSVAAEEEEDDADALELDSAPALLLPLASSAALADRGWRGCAGQALSPGSMPVGDSSTATECSAALLFGLMIP